MNKERLLAQHKRKTILIETLKHLDKMLNIPENGKKKLEGLMTSLDTVISDFDLWDYIMQEVGGLRSYDIYTYYHSLNVSVLSTVTGMCLGFSDDRLIDLGLSGALHDIGKQMVPLSILNKKGSLSEEEFNIMKLHPVCGYDYIKSHFSVFSVEVFLGILDHHEKLDGTGYPRGLTGENISLFGRIISVCDIYDALTSDRPYHKAFLPSEAVEYLYASKDLDKNVVRAFTHSIYAYPPGTSVQLSDGKRGIVIKNHCGYPCRPLIKLKEDNFINLLDTRNLNLTITAVLGSAAILNRTDTRSIG